MPLCNRKKEELRRAVTEHLLMCVAVVDCHLDMTNTSVGEASLFRRNAAASYSMLPSMHIYVMEFGDFVTSAFATKLETDIV